MGISLTPSTPLVDIVKNNFPFLMQMKTRITEITNASQDIDQLETCEMAAISMKPKRMGWTSFRVSVMYARKEEETAIEFVNNAANAFAEVHTFLPEKIILHPLDIVALPHDEWEAFKYHRSYPLISISSAWDEDVLLNLKRGEALCIGYDRVEIIEMTPEEMPAITASPEKPIAVQEGALAPVLAMKAHAQKIVHFFKKTVENIENFALSLEKYGYA